MLVDIRGGDRADAIPGAYRVPRTVLEWRVASDAWRNEALDGKRLILVCDHGYSSTLAAATLVNLVGPRSHDGLPGMGPPD